MAVSLTRIKDGIKLLRVDRPKVRNALNWAAMDEFGDCIEQAYHDSEIRVLIVTGSEGAFISGGDLKELSNYPTYEDGERLAEKMSSALNRLEALPCPVIAAVNGAARGGGMEVALACDLRVMSADADIGFVHVVMGLTPGWGGGHRLIRLVGYSRALEWLATGRILDGQEALSLGLVNHLAKPKQALEEALVLADSIAQYPRQTVSAIKRLLRASVLLPPESALALERTEFAALWATDWRRTAAKNFINRK